MCVCVCLCITCSVLVIHLVCTYVHKYCTDPFIQYIRMYICMPWSHILGERRYSAEFRFIDRKGVQSLKVQRQLLPEGLALVHELTLGPVVQLQPQRKQNSPQYSEEQNYQTRPSLTADVWC